MRISNAYLGAIMQKVTRRDAVLTGLAAGALPALGALASKPARAASRRESSGGGASHKFEMNIEDTQITLVGKQTFHTFAFGGQVPAPLFHVREGDNVEVVLNNLTTLPHTIHWHGLLQLRTAVQN